MEPVSRRGAEAQRMMENDLDFGEAVMKTGISRGVNGLQESVSLRLCVSAPHLSLMSERGIVHFPRR